MKKHFILLSLLLSNFLNAQDGQLVGIVNIRRVGLSMPTNNGFFKFATYNTNSNTLNLSASKVVDSVSFIRGAHAYDKVNDIFYFTYFKITPIRYIIGVNVTTGEIVKKYPIPNNLFYEFMTIDENKQELYCISKSSLNNNVRGISFIKINLNTGTQHILQDLTTANIILDNSGSVVLDSKNNHYIISNNNALTVFNTITGQVKQTVNLSLPNNFNGFRNMVLDNTSSIIYGISRIGSNIHIVGINVNDFSTIYTSSTSFLNNFAVGVSAFNESEKTYFFSNHNGILEYSVRNNLVVKEHKLFKTPSSDSTLIMYIFKNKLNPNLQNLLAKNLIAYPNPVLANHSLTLNMKQFSLPVNCTIFNGFGIPIHQFKMNQKTHQLNLNSLKSGVYFIKADREMIKFIIQ